jgi:hypothetical protein
MTTEQETTVQKQWFNIVYEVLADPALVARAQQEMYADEGDEAQQELGELIDDEIRSQDGWGDVIPPEGFNPLDRENWIDDPTYHELYHALKHIGPVSDRASRATLKLMALYVIDELMPE